MRPSCADLHLGREHRSEAGYVVADCTGSGLYKPLADGAGHTFIIGRLILSGERPMWKPEHRVAADRSGLRYPSDLADAEWLLVERLIPPARHGGRRRSVSA